MCTMHLHILLTEFCTHIYSYIADDTVDLWVGEVVLTFGHGECIWAFWRCGFLIESFALILTIPFWVCTHERPTKYGIMYTYTPYYTYMNWIFSMSSMILKVLNFSHFLQLTSSDLAKRSHDYRHVSRWNPGMLQSPLLWIWWGFTLSRPTSTWFSSNSTSLTSNLSITVSHLSCSSYPAFSAGKLWGFHGTKGETVGKLPCDILGTWWRNPLRLKFDKKGKTRQGKKRRFERVFLVQKWRQMKDGGKGK